MGSINTKWNYQSFMAAEDEEKRLLNNRWVGQSDSTDIGNYATFLLTSLQLAH